MLLGEGLSVGDQLVGAGLQPGQEVLAGHLQGAIDEAVEVSIVAEGQVPFEDHPVEAAEHSYNGSGELGDKASGALHGVLLQKVPQQHHSGSRTPFLLSPCWLRLCRVRDHVAGRPAGP